MKHSHLCILSAIMALSQFSTTSHLHAANDSGQEAQDALSKLLSEGHYGSSNPFQLLMTADVGYSNYTTVTVSRSAPVFSSHEASCSFESNSKDMTQTVKLQESNDTIKIEVTKIVNGSEKKCSIIFANRKLTVIEDENKKSISSLKYLTDGRGSPIEEN